MSTTKRPRQLIFITFSVMVFGLAMLVYWGMFIFQQIPIEGVPIISELVTAFLAIISGIGFLKMKSWSVPLSLVLSGLWLYGVITGIQLVLENGLDFRSPFGALADAILFPMVMVYSIYMAIYIWRKRNLFA